MIIKENQLEQILSNKKGFLCFLIYGPNEGLVRDQINKLKNNYSTKHEYEEIKISVKELDEDSYILDNTLKTPSMFYKGKVLVIDSPKDKHLSLLEPMINDAPQDSVIIVKSDNLKKTSKIRKYFETHDLCYSLACYEDDTRSLMKHIEDFIRKNSLQLNKDIKNYLLQSLSNDRMINHNELEKIALYVSNTDKELTLDHVKYLLNDSSSQSLNKMNETVMNGNTSKSSKIINKLLSEGTSPISLLRSIMNYLARVQMAKIEMKKGSNFESAIKVLKPPVFWKDKDSFQKHCLKWPLASIEKNLHGLTDAEILCKLNSKLSAVNCEKSILLIANRGKQYFKN